MIWKLLGILTLSLLAIPQFVQSDTLPGDHTVLLDDGQTYAWHSPGFMTPYTVECTECHGQCLQGDGTIPTCYRCHDRIWSEPPPCSVYTCDGFAPPMRDFPVSFKRNHAIPLRAELFDGEDEITDADIVAAPFMEVTKPSSATGDSTIVTDELLPTGQSDDGNEFYYTDSGLWQLIFDTKIEFYTSPGTYEIKMKSGDPLEYLIDPTCVTEFVVE